MSHTNTPAAPSAQQAAGSIDTPEFRNLLSGWMATGPCFDALVAHIDHHASKAYLTGLAVGCDEFDSRTAATPAQPIATQTELELKYSQLSAGYTWLQNEAANAGFDSIISAILAHGDRYAPTDMRVRLEAWATTGDRAGPGMHRDDYDDYRDSLVLAWWQAWRASAAAHAAPVAQPIAVSAPTDERAATSAEYCPACGGSGETTVMSDAGPDAYEMPANCPHCNGSGGLDDAYRGVVALLEAERKQCMELRGAAWCAKWSTAPARAAAPVSGPSDGDALAGVIKCYPTFNQHHAKTVWDIALRHARAAPVSGQGESVADDEGLQVLLANYYLSDEDTEAMGIEREIFAYIDRIIDSRPRSEDSRVKEEHSAAAWRTQVNALEAENMKLRERLNLYHQHKSCDIWYWQGDEDDHLESMSNGMAVVIRADQLRALASTTPQKADDE